MPCFLFLGYQNPPPIFPVVLLFFVGGGGGGGGGREVTTHIHLSQVLERLSVMRWRYLRAHCPPPLDIG